MIGSLSSEDDPTPVIERLRRLGGSTCFELGGRIANSDDSVPDSALSLRESWNTWARAHVTSYIDLDSPGERRVFPAQFFRATAAREARSGSPLRDLYCPIADAACVAGTARWRRDAEDWFAQFAASASRDRAIECLEARGDSASGETGCNLDQCIELARQAPAAQRFMRFRTCIDTFAVMLADGLPLIGLAAPDRGWLIVSGPRGHYEFCDGVWAYDLESGTAHEFASCGHLALQPGGGVNIAATQASRYRVVRRGWVAPAALREAAWFALTLPELQMIGHVGSVPDLPADIDAMQVADAQYNGSASVVVQCSSANTQLQWSYFRDGRALANGNMTWPGATLIPRNDYLVELVQKFEGTWTSTLGRPKQKGE